MARNTRLIFMSVSVCFIILTNSFGAPDLASVRQKLETLKKAVSDAKSKGIDTRYEDVTIKTAGLFLDTYIPWDMEHPADLASIFYKWSWKGDPKQDLRGTPEQEATRAPIWELNQTSEILDGALAGLNVLLKNPQSRRIVPKINVDHLKVVNGFLCSDGVPVISGGFIWAPEEMDHAWFGLIGGEA